jgi:hypothetical protein
VIDERGSGVVNAIPYAMKRLQILLANGFDRNEAHRRTYRRLINRLRIRRIVLRPFDERLYEAWVDQSDGAAFGEETATQ